MGRSGHSRSACQWVSVVLSCSTDCCQLWALALLLLLLQVARLYEAWVATMPRVMPFYAVKCNPEPSMVALLAALGAGFDCASIQVGHQAFVAGRTSCAAEARAVCV